MKLILTFTLLMIPGAMTSMIVTGLLGGQINITCTYKEKHRENAKYFCKGLWFTCSDLIKTVIKDKWVDSGRFSLYDNTREAVFTVTIRDLSEQDSGMYYCAVDKSGIDTYTEVNLNITAKQKPPPSASPSSSSSSTTTIPPISLKAQPSTFEFTSDSPSVSNDSSVIIGVSVVLLLIIGIVSCIVTFYKKHQAQAKDPDSASKMSEPGTENSEAVPQMLNIYEEIEDTKTHTDCKTAQLPANHSGSSLIGWSAIPILSFIGLVLAIKDLCKRRQAQNPHSASKMPEPGTENTEVVCEIMCLYEQFLKRASFVRKLQTADLALIQIQELK
ncbi:hypothetical protein QQF64_000172 [Cirrhinus molitorella]|uniref:Ig-like domain-containing protein n=1 Tax=Cirrhinus molitorella TaxID=172907 RepID=A0ABR3NWE3_9TELE